MFFINLSKASGSFTIIFIEHSETVTSIKPIANISRCVHYS